MTGVSAIGICDENYEAKKNSAFKILDYTDLEHMMLSAIAMECRNCISSEGQDCYQHGTITCPFIEVRKAVGLENVHEF
ncbi:MAG: hypothetical protein KAS67_03420 [Thermoplasmata archaeon]|nr:hypothetical protein [Thermoplasmata archaeon]